MKVIIFGATGMVGQGVLRECLKDQDIKQVLSVGRTQLKQNDPKIQELMVESLEDYSSVSLKLKGFDACFFCLGTTVSGKSEEEYTKITYDFTLAAARKLSELNPRMTFVYVSGEGADSTETSKIMWARVRGKTENDLLKLPFKAVYIFRPGTIQPLDGIKSKTDLYRISYNVVSPILPVLRWLFPSMITTTRMVGKAMIAAAKGKATKSILSNRDFLLLSGVKKAE